MLVLSERHPAREGGWGQSTSQTFSFLLPRVFQFPPFSGQPFQVLNSIKEYFSPEELEALIIKQQWSASGITLMSKSAAYKMDLEAFVEEALAFAHARGSPIIVQAAAKTRRELKFYYCSGNDLLGVTIHSDVLGSSEQKEVFSRAEVQHRKFKMKFAKELALVKRVIEVCLADKRFFILGRLR